jgi:hypothetical protein
MRKPTVTVNEARFTLEKTKNVDDKETRKEWAQVLNNKRKKKVERRKMGVKTV